MISSHSPQEPIILIPVVESYFGNFVLNLSLLQLVSFALHSMPEHWSNAVSDIINTLQNARNSSQVNSCYNNLLTSVYGINKIFSYMYTSTGSHARVTVISQQDLNYKHYQQKHTAISKKVAPVIHDA